MNLAYLAGTLLGVLFVSGIVSLFVPAIYALVQVVRKKKKPARAYLIFWGIPTALLFCLISVMSMPDMVKDAPLRDREVTQTQIEPEPSNQGAESNVEQQIESTDQQDAFYLQNEVDGELPEVSSEIVGALTGAGYTVDHATQIQQVLNTVGITSIEIYGMTGEPESGLNSMSCYANGSMEDDHRFYMTTEDGVIFYVGFLDEDLYDVDRGGFLKEYGDVHIPETEVDVETFSTLQLMAEEAVKSCLNYPNTASFDMFSWGVGRSDENYKIIGTVSAQNGFGVESDMPFGVWFVQQKGEFVPSGVEINGSRVK